MSKAEYERLKMSGKIKGTKEAVEELLDVLHDAIQNTKSKKFWFRFEVEEQDDAQ